MAMSNEQQPIPAARMAMSNEQQLARFDSFFAKLGPREGKVSFDQARPLFERAHELSALGSDTYSVPSDLDLILAHTRRRVGVGSATPRAPAEEHVA